MKYLKTLNLIGAMLFLSVSTNSANAALVLTIDTYTIDELSFTISGTFDADTIGTQPGKLAIKNDWSNNLGVNTDLFASTITATNNSISGIGGISINDGHTWGDGIHFGQFGLGGSAPFTMGTAINGSITLSGTGAFDPADAATLQLVSGFNSATQDWTRLEANAVSAVPVPAAVWLMGSAIAGLFGFSRRESTAA